MLVIFVFLTISPQVDFADQMITRFAGVVGVKTPIGLEGPRTSVPLSGPSTMFVDSAGGSFCVVRLSVCLFVVCGMLGILFS